MYINKAHLFETVTALQNNQMDIITYVEQMCDRVEELDTHIKAMLTEPDRRSRLLAEAQELKDRFGNIDRKPPLYGALVAVKDIFHVSDVVTRAGTSVPPECFAGPEAACVLLLRESGAIILGKSVTTEFAYFEPGPTRNPHNPLHTPGGSSSGSAAAIASGFCTLALGTQTVGSVIRPAAYCGIIGFKPTIHRIPTRGTVYFSRSVDHIGLFTQDMAGMRIAVEVLCQAWRPVSEPATFPVLAVPVGPYLEQVEPDALEAFEHQVTELETIGCVVKRVPAFSDLEQINRMHRTIISAEFAQEHKEIYTEYAELYRPLTAALIEEGKRISIEELSSARANCNRLRADLGDQMDQEGIDLWVSPSATGPAPKGIQSTGSPNMNLVWTHAGMPVVTLPAGKAQNGLPLGLQLVGAFGADEYLLAWSQMISTSYFT